MRAHGGRSREMVGARKVQRGQRRGEGRGAIRGKGHEGTFGFLTRCCTRCYLRPLKVKSGFGEESWEVNDEVL
jgi:hypothetical protein